LFPHAASRNAKKPHAARAAFAQALYWAWSARQYLDAAKKQNSYETNAPKKQTSPKENTDKSSESSRFKLERSGKCATWI
jgi:hypothetical protein